VQELQMKLDAAAIDAVVGESRWPRTVPSDHPLFSSDSPVRSFCCRHVPYPPPTLYRPAPLHHTALPYRRQVTAARSEVEALQHRHDSLQQEYAAYKRHSASLLKQVSASSALIQVVFLPHYSSLPLCRGLLMWCCEYIVQCCRDAYTGIVGAVCFVVLVVAPYGVLCRPFCGVAVILRQLSTAASYLCISIN